MFVLLVSLVTPLLGALTLPLSRRLSGAPPLLDGFALAAVASVVLLHLLPEAIATLGPWAIGLFLAGLLAPAAVEAFVAMRTRRGHQHGVGMWVLLAVAVAVHEFFDGTALGIALGDVTPDWMNWEGHDAHPVALDPHAGHDHAPTPTPTHRRRGTSTATCTTRARRGCWRWPPCCTGCRWESPWAG